MALREVLVKLGVEIDEQSEQKANTSIDNLKEGAKKLAAVFAVGALAKGISSFVKNITAVGDELDKTSIQLGLTSAALQEFRFAAGLAGVDGVAMSQSLGKLQKNAFEAARGNKKLAEDFALLGVNVNDAEGNLKSADVLITEVGQGFSEMTNESERVALSLNLMGRAGRQLLPLFTQGAAGINAVRQEARELGGGLDQELIGAAVKLTDNVARMDFAFLGLKNILGKALIPVVDRVVKRIIEFAKEMRGPVLRAVDAGERVFRGLSTALVAVVEGWKLLLGFLSPVQQALLGITVIVGVLVTLLGLPIVLLLAIGAAILLVIEDFVAMGEGADSVTGTIIDGFNDLVDEFGSVGAALKEIFFTAMNFWFETSRDTFDNIVGLVEGIADSIVAPFRAAGEAIDAIFARVRAGARTVSGFFGGPTQLATTIQTVASGAGTAGGGGLSAPPRVSAPGGGSRTVISNPRTSIEVNVDASGATDPAAVGDAIESRVSAALEAQQRQILQDFAVAK